MPILASFTIQCGHCGIKSFMVESKERLRDLSRAAGWRCVAERGERVTVVDLCPRCASRTPGAV